MSNTNRTGNLSIDSDNIFPIIKKWLYSDHDIFIRELVSNGCDAITKLKKLEIMGEYTFPEDYKASIQVIVNPEEKTMKFIDTGLGMTADEVEEYITKIAFSGATAFLEKYKDKTNADEMIGHFGLGFYSAFMVADEVHIDTLSYRDGATAVHWECDGGTQYTIGDGSKTTVGTEITLYLNEESVEFANEYRTREVLDKYCSFMPVEIFLSKANAEPEYETIEESELRDDDVVIEHIHEDAKTEEKENENGEKEIVEVSPAKEMVKIQKRPVALNDIHPLWTKHPNECSEDEYKDFYRKVFMDYKEPLFWIHLNMDYPFNLKGILYFPKINTEYDSVEGTIKLYNNQVFIADNIKEVIPEFLMLLKGVIDCPDLPLNVSRSALQNDGTVKKISEYISKKVADKLTGMCKTDRENYEKYWDDISPFIKYGCIKDDKFYDRIKDCLLFKNLDGKYLTLQDFVEENKKEDTAEAVKETESTENAEEKQKEKTVLFYVTDEVQQSQYINLFKEQGIDAVILKHNIDSAFITHLERQDDTIKFERIDADVNADMKEEVSEEDLKEEKETLTDVFHKALNNDKLEVKIEKLKNASVSSMIVLSEETRRMQDMMKMYNMYGMDPNMFGGPATLVLNANNELVQYIFNHKDSEHVPMMCEQLYDLAMLSHKPLAPEEMTKFITRSNKIMMLLAK
ncbi:molecular chaperone HtpG [Faecalicatena fissicatena]|jgi:molecular chaperone HtpG|uniref:Molecular chaperone HtpG n=1 Tax=Faecalicatena fissicatena TaxID=290055 RepID=A0ABX2GUH6_9FIRM|nr:MULTISPECIES: molecular chaperone HtpG [Clostridia]MBT9654195.1 molecular chaperone HtpG [Ruminococcus sp. MCC718]MCB5866447.1 molecular chaperone HtpG [Faecalicatena fissicatena]NSD81890.1 molecular chaperone HtpG [Faecalicatena fissicatena]NSE54402.1 molecular chaperone HtpG [Faecalicatena fissicatena]NSE63158.1 molecular chaperone HtpG [Faecalicatena fissicatena]